MTAWQKYVLTIKNIVEEFLERVVSFEYAGLFFAIEKKMHVTLA